MRASIPLVSVIIPTFNRGYTIARALHSVLRQTYENLEVIVIDDGSTDDTEHVVTAIDDARIRYIKNPVRLGAAAARNVGIKLASGEFISFQDSDDEWLCQKLEKQMDAFVSLEDNVDVVYTGFLRYQSESALYFPAKAAQRKSGNILDILLYGNFITTQAAVVRKDCLLSVGLFDESLPRLQDWELFIRIAKKYNFYFINEPLLCAFHSAESITADKSLLPRALQAILEKHHDVFSQDKDCLANFYMNMAKAAWTAGIYRQGLRYFLSCWHAAPFRLKNWGEMLVTMMGGRVARFISRGLRVINGK